MYCIIIIIIYFHRPYSASLSVPASPERIEPPSRRGRLSQSVSAPRRAEYRDRPARDDADSTAECTASGTPQGTGSVATATQQYVIKMENRSFSILNGYENIDYNIYIFQN